MHAGAGSPLSAEHLAQIDAARVRAKKILKAARVAAFNAWTAAIIGGSALALGITDLTSAVLGGAIILVAAIEFKGASKFKKMDPIAPALCGWNQLLLLAIVAAYCLWSMFAPSSSSQSLSEALGADVASLETTIRRGFYALVLGGSVLTQGLTSVYYFSRGKHLRTHLRNTPPWVVELQRRAA
jgi:hypothetical protein